MDIYHTENSIYEIDLEGKRYRRYPKPMSEQRVDSDRLKYAKWMPLADIPNPVQLVADDSNPYRAPELRGTLLHIMHESSTLGILTTPIVFMARDVAH